MRKNYEVLLIKRGAVDPQVPLEAMRAASLALGYKHDHFPRGFHYKSDAVRFAREVCGTIEIITATNLWCQVVNLRTGKAVHMLPRSKTSCRVCGNELERKVRCPLCGSEHSYL